MGDDFRTIAASKVRPRRMRWLMRDRIPLGAFTLVVGDGGLGKTTWCLDVAAKLSRGELDGDLAGQPARTLILSTEDDAETTIVPRLMAAGADLDQITLLADHEDGLYVPPFLPDDQDAVAECIGSLGVRFVVFDPLVAFLSAKTNSWKTQDVRAALGPVGALARRFDLAGAGIMHLNKGTSTDPTRRMGESAAFRHASRSALIFGADPDDARGKDGPRRVIAQDKANLAAPGLKSLAYEIESVTVYGHDNEPITAPRLECTGEHRARAEDLLAPRVAHEDDEPHELDPQLYEQLTAIPRPQSNLIEAVGLERTDAKARRRLAEMKDAGYVNGSGREGWWKSGKLPPWAEVSFVSSRDTSTQRHNDTSANGYHDPSLIDGLEDDLARWGVE